jgi:predicted AAA+ superfamily ATPase
LRRGAANLLGGRATRFELFGVTARELGREFDLDRILNRGYLPRIYTAERAGWLLASYVADYLKEEVGAEGLVRNLPVFSRFLDVAALSDTDLVNASNIARDCSVSSHTVDSYFEILVDTLLGRWLPAYTKRPKRRVIQAPKFFFADVGVVNQLAKRGAVLRGGELYGKALENWVFHELSAAISYGESTAELTYWRLASGIEVDFVIDSMRIAIEVKASTRISSDHLKGLRALIDDHPKVQRRIVVCLEPKRRRTDDGIEILPVNAFVDDLGSGTLLG